MDANATSGAEAPVKSPAEGTPGAEKPGRSRRRRVVGTVRSSKMRKTITVQSETRRPHPKYGKYIRHFTRYYVHDEKNEAREGDTVEIVETRPLSKLKRWRLLRIVKRGIA